MDNIFFDIGVLIIVATFVGAIARSLKQPLIPAYILSGILIGPTLLGLITDQNTIATISEIGIAILLFTVGMELDFKRLKNIGHVATAGTLIQVGLIFLIGYGVAAFFPIFTGLDRIYIGIMVALSSTMVVVKVLADRKELNTLHGRIIIGVLLMQDIIAILALSTLSSLTEFSFLIIALAFVKAALIMVATILLSKYIFPSLFKIAAESHEILLLASITVCFLFAMALHALGFSIAVGGFLAGIALANLPYKLEIVSRVRSLKDFFATMFFVSLGMELNFTGFETILWPAIVFTGIIVLVKPFIIMLVTSFFGYSKRTVFSTGTYLAQISEFSLIIVAAGNILGQISDHILSLTIAVTVLTITVSTYYMKFNHVIYSVSSGGLHLFEHIAKKRNKELQHDPPEGKFKAILIGYSLLGFSIVKRFRQMKTPFLVIDFNPDLIRKLMHENVACMYGDISDAELIDKIDLKTAEIVVSTIPHYRDNKLLIEKVKAKNPKTQIFVTSDSVSHALKLYDEGADYVILPHFLGGDHVSLMLEEVSPDINKLIATKLKHIEELNQRKDLGHEHPFSRHTKRHH